jgi:hypothetical protein
VAWATQRSRARASASHAAHGQPTGSCSTSRRAERVIRPGRAGRVRAASWHHQLPAGASPMAATQPSRLCARAAATSQAALAASSPEGTCRRPPPAWRSRIAQLDRGVAAVILVQLDGGADSVGDEGVVAPGGPARPGRRPGGCGGRSAGRPGRGSRRPARRHRRGRRAEPGRPRRWWRSRRRSAWPGGRSWRSGAGGGGRPGWSWPPRTPSPSASSAPRWRRPGAPMRPTRRPSGPLRGWCWPGRSAAGRAPPRRCRPGWPAADARRGCGGGAVAAPCWGWPWTWHTVASRSMVIGPSPGQHQPPTPG